MAGQAGTVMVRRLLLYGVLSGMVLSGVCGSVWAGAPVLHPLDPLTAAEYKQVVSVLERSGRADGDSQYPLIILNPPDKTAVLAWKPGAPVPRAAFVILRKGGTTYEAVVDIGRSTLRSWRTVADVQPNILLSEEWINAQQIVRADKRWQAAVRARGIDDFRAVVCIPHTIGNFGIASERGRRLVKVTCYDGRGTGNFWARPISGLIVVVDHDAYSVVEVIDTGVVPVPAPPADVPGAAGTVSAVDSSPAAPGTKAGTIAVDGHAVRWDRWRFRFHLDPRVGLVVSTVRFDDGGRERPVLYEGSLSELFVPYMDPSEGWYFRTYLDAGEYGLGKLAATLQRGLDCPADALLFDAVFADEWGDSYIHRDAACLFERDTGEVAWRHYEAVHGTTVVRARTELVLRSIASVGSYDYVFDWIFRRDGSIEIAAGATGITQVRAVAGGGHSEGDRPFAFGRQVAPHTVAVNHDHFFCYRLDLDVDGRTNSLAIERLTPRRVRGKGPRRSLWTVERRIAATERSARLRIDPAHPALWRVVNPGTSGPNGYPVSYQLEPKTNTLPLLDPSDPLQRRAGFTDYHLWATPYDPHERYAAGVYPNQSAGGDGLPRWTAGNRPILDTDIVLWYTLGLHHVVRAEDWPVMPTVRSAFELRPFDFFDGNPTVRRSTRK